MVEGKNILVYIKKGYEWIATACEKTCSISIERSFVRITDPTYSDIYRRLPLDTDWSISGNGLVDYGREMSAYGMLESLLAGQRIQVKFYAKKGNNYALYSGWGYFKEITQDGNVSGFSSFSYLIVADSKLTIEKTIPDSGNENKLIPLLSENGENIVENGEGSPLKIK